MKQQHEKISTLQEWWPNPLISAAPYASEAHSASELTATLFKSSDVHSLQWLSPVICELRSDDHASDGEGPETIMDVEHEDLGQIALADHFLGNVSNNMEGSVNKDEDEKESMRIYLDWQIPSVRVRDICLEASNHTSLAPSG